MRFLAFQKAFKAFPVISIHDIEKVFPDFDHRRLVEWQEKNYIHKIRRGYYCFSDVGRSEQFLFFSANKIYAPSYISLESGLSFYQFIPESVFGVTSVSAKNTASFSTSLGTFEYKHIKESLFWGYRLYNEKGMVVKIAEPEKVLLDFFYLNKIHHADDFESFRLNKTVIAEVIRKDKLEQYLKVYDSVAMEKRIRMFVNWIYAESE